MSSGLKDKVVRCKCQKCGVFIEAGEKSISSVVNGHKCVRESMGWE